MKQQLIDGRGQTGCEPFPRLPLELVHLICAFACKTTSSSSFPHIDFRTTRTIALVSKRLQQIAIPILYGDVTLSKPSDLWLYARTVNENFTLALETHTLWAGATSETLPPISWWPLTYEPCTMIRSSIADPARLPRDVPVGRFWPVSHSTSGQWAEEAVINILQEACKSVGGITDKPGVDLNRHAFLTLDGQQLTRDEWVVRVFEVQEALDDYLLDLRNRQDTTRSSKNGAKTTVPGTGTYTTASAYVQSDADKRITKLRARREFDCFEHPLMYARSGSGFFIWDAVPPPIPFTEVPAHEDGAFANEARPLDPVYLLTTLERHEVPRTEEIAEFLAAKPSIATLLMALEDVLYTSISITSLALTGCLETLVTSRKASRALPEVRLLSLGPSPPQWDPRIFFRYPELSKLEELHITGRNLHMNERRQLLTRMLPLENLKKVEWNWWPLQRLNMPELWTDSIGIAVGLHREDPIATLWWLVCGPELWIKPDRGYAATFHLTVRAHHEDVADFRRGAHPELLNHPRLTMVAANTPPARNQPAAGSPADGLGNVFEEIAALNIDDDDDSRARRREAEEVDPKSHVARVLAFEQVRARWEESIRASPPPKGQCENN
ncbi:hypothetical protein BCV69DRAFT_301611 [Microstroma glucosiphilum]|uniref:Uncharacterized protein n=1 Tax=Pseudomicrostroma glucosiphilum TaxID=1684307 RepID=A0A316TXR0_9BASI|nr:hypothetical protein BCV69DRAFT_301611 [Pseudomicrostroma glucosiphilum]PWN18159.1 hypothetical protein BCV69DRAFT_301611 [Pseudomicrostroma glucosiphilum]